MTDTELSVHSAGSTTGAVNWLMARTMLGWVMKKMMRGFFCRATIAAF